MSVVSDGNEGDICTNSDEEVEGEGGEEDEEEEEPGDIPNYYDDVHDDVELQDTYDPEDYQFTCLSYWESQRVLAQDVAVVAGALKVCVGL